MTSAIGSAAVISSLYGDLVKRQGLFSRGGEHCPMNLTQSPRFVVRPPAVALLVAGFGLIALAVVYFVTPAHQLPSLLPGHDATSRHHIKHGLAMLMLAAGAWVGAWFVSAPT